MSEENEVEKKVAEVKDEVTEKAAEVKEEVTEKVAEIKDEVVEKAAEVKEEVTEAAAKKKGKKWPIVVGVVVAVLVVAGIGGFIWHEQPSFCSAICHTPMDPYLTTYEEPANQAGTDKWGNEVKNTNTMLAVTHREQGKSCLSCHVPTMSEQISEGMNWVSGNYEYPLQECSLEDLTAASGADPESFCLNASCHNVTREDLQQKTTDMAYNPHKTQHGEVACSECHKSHRASVDYCTQCHTESNLPDGWLTYAESQKLQKA
ncbi:MAG: cytochrome c3 family protein [Raoultibacter sp.]